jgi:hypothetical protein
MFYVILSVSEGSKSQNNKRYVILSVSEGSFPQRGEDSPFTLRVPPMFPLVTINVAGTTDVNFVHG